MRKERTEMAFFFFLELLNSPTIYVDYTFFLASGQIWLKNVSKRKLKFEKTALKRILATQTSTNP